MKHLLNHTVVKCSSQTRHTPLGYARPETESTVHSKGHTQTEGRDRQVREASSTMQRHNRETTVTCEDEQEVSEGKRHAKEIIQQNSKYRI